MAQEVQSYGPAEEVGSWIVGAVRNSVGLEVVGSWRSVADRSFVAVERIAAAGAHMNPVQERT